MRNSSQTQRQVCLLLYLTMLLVSWMNELIWSSWWKWELARKTEVSGEDISNVTLLNTSPRLPELESRPGRHVIKPANSSQKLSMLTTFSNCLTPSWLDHLSWKPIRNKDLLSSLERRVNCVMLFRPQNVIYKLLFVIKLIIYKRK
jgi:hypothetical protein